MCDKGLPGDKGFGTFSIDDFLYWRGEGTHNDELEAKLPYRATGYWKKVAEAEGTENV